jgi:ankyrin repeat protein
VSQRAAPADRLLARIKNNPIVAILIAIGTVVIALSTFSNAVRNLLGLLKGPSAASARAELQNLSAAYTPQALVSSIREGDGRKVKLFLAAGMTPNAKDDEGNTALMHAIAGGRTEMISDLVNAKADVNEKNNGGATALDWAAARGQVETVRLLADKGAGAETIDEAFVSAAEKAHPDVMRLLQQKGARLNQIRSRALLVAAGSTIVGVADPDRSETIKFLLSQGADVNAKDQDGWTSLLLAADRGRTPVVQTLLDGGADVNAKCDCRGYLSGGWTALMIAAREGQNDILNLLLAKHAAVDIRNNTGTTALAEAAAKGDAAAVQALLSAGADVNARDEKGRTPLMQAVLESQVEATKVLLQQGARVEEKDSQGKTALQLARGQQAGADLVRLLTTSR